MPTVLEMSEDVSDVAVTTTQPGAVGVRHPVPSNLAGWAVVLVTPQVTFPCSSESGRPLPSSTWATRVSGISDIEIVGGATILI